MLKLPKYASFRLIYVLLPLTFTPTFHDLISEIDLAAATGEH